MEKTIKAELERNIISSELLNENSLLIISNDENSEYSTVSVRYIEQDSIKEDRIASLIPSVTVQHNENAVAVFLTNAAKEMLITVYDLDNHTYVENDFLKTIYNEKVAHGKPMQYIKSPKS